MKWIKNLKDLVLKSYRGIDKINRQKAIDDLEWQVQELKHIFALLTIGQFIGLPSTPLPITLKLLPEMHEEFAIMLSKINTAYSPLSEQFSKLDAL